MSIIPTWHLSDLFSGFDDPKFLAVFETIPQAIHDFSKTYRSRLTTLSATELAAAFNALERVLLPLYEASQFVSLNHSIDTAAQVNQHWQNRIDALQVDVQTALVFFQLELGSLSLDAYNTLMQSDDLHQYRYTLARYRAQHTYKLSEPEEKILAIKALHGSTAFEQLYTELTASFMFELDYEGSKKQLNGSELRALRHHPDKAVRSEAMALFLNRYSDQCIPLGKSFISVITDYNQTYKLRGYPQAISVMNQHNDLSDAVVDQLHHLTTQSNTLVQRYYKIKAKLLGQDTLSLSDIYAPMPQSNRRYSFDESKQLVLTALKQFDDDFYAKAKLMFDTNRIHAKVLPTKQGGAYCSSSTHRVNPYVMLNFLGQPRDVSTMAHELGHAIHAQYSTKLPLIQQHAILPLCETASVFCEMIVSESLYAHATTVAEKQALLTDKLEDLFATSHRQNMFSRFEQRMHTLLESGPLNTQVLCEAYTDELRLLFGDSVEYPEHYQWEWLTIPHFLAVPFYVYAYNFGNLLVIGLYQRYKRDPETFIKPFKHMLSLGQSVDPATLCQTVGVDLSDPDFWSESLAYIADLITELDSLSD